MIVTAGPYKRPDPAHPTDDDPVSPGMNVSDGVAVTVTHIPPAHSASVTTPVQFVTSTNTGTPTIAAVPTGGDESSEGRAAARR